MPVFTNPSFVIRVLLAGRKETIDSHSYATRDKAEADLARISEARKQGIDVDLPWLQMLASTVQAAWIEDQTTAAGFTVWSPDVA